MITPELIGYIRGEFAKGRTREEIHKTLTEGGGWSETDLSEAFRIVIPMQGFAQGPMAAKAKIVSPKTKILVYIVAAVVFCFAAWWFFSPQINRLWDSAINSGGFSIPSFGLDKIFGTDKAPVKDNTVVKNTNTVKNCGTSTAPDLQNSSLYKNDSVLNCLGDSALSCTSARGVLRDALFPTIFQITREDAKGLNTCNFKLSYDQDSALVDIAGKKLAGQYILCPVGIVKMLDESNLEAAIFKAPDTDNPSKYASQIYFYGTLGLFIEQNLDQNKIQSLGCSGPYIDSMMASFKKMQSQAPK